MCKLYDILYALLPWKQWRSWLIRTHFDRCPRCRQKYSPATMAPPLRRLPDWIEKEPSLWPKIAVRLEHMAEEASGKAVRSAFWSLSWRLAAAAFLIVAVGGVYLLRRQSMQQRAMATISSLPAAQPEFQVFSAKIAGKDARTFIYTSKADGMVFIWYERM